jgi:prolyl-tRNA synthetase
MSTRMIGGVIMTHGDDKGLVLPPRLAPYQVVIVPIGRSGQLDAVLDRARQLAGELRAAGIRAHVDERTHLSPGFKFNDWELRGAPVRLELGPRDLEAGTAVMARRVGGDGKQPIALADAPATLAAVLDELQAHLLQRATELRDRNTRPVDDWSAFVDAVATGWALALHCGRPPCEDEIKAETAATPRCIPLDGAPETGTCVRCGEPAAYGKRVIFGRAY